MTLRGQVESNTFMCLYLAVEFATICISGYWLPPNMSHLNGTEGGSLCTATALHKGGTANGRDRHAQYPIAAVPRSHVRLQDNAGALLQDLPLCELPSDRRLSKADGSVWWVGHTRREALIGV
jgi:hypothetical protein